MPRCAPRQPRLGQAHYQPAAASARLLRHRGRAVIIDSIEDFHARINAPDLDVDLVLVLRGCGPKDYPGMPEVANMLLLKKLLEQGVRDMLLVCESRMSGTAYGTVVLHMAPEARSRSHVRGITSASRTGRRTRPQDPPPRPPSPVSRTPARRATALPAPCPPSRRRPGPPRRLQQLRRKP
ncbi:dihydroxy-acid dehydratase [Streptomyces sp. NPDC091280]|uniref:dihydroxy-acid dehydratase domain-containing protein n=1 Tax=Streptomyces sp. NPDC091280 TaxID=3365984 RepID=UPI0037FA4C10